MAAPGNEIDLLSYSDGVCLDTESLATLLCRGDVADQPIAVVGVAGPVRSGKSFLLSFLSRYLRSRSWANSDDWIGDSETSLQDGFSWRGGSHPHTQGIKAWNEIFEVPYKEGKRLNVLLVDTQGLFGSNMTKDDDVKLFSLATAFCSNLIFNVERKIDERKLESLELFFRYAAAVCGQDDHQDAGKGVKPFQSLTFLVRDWPYAQEIPFGAAGGKSYVDKCVIASTAHAVGCSVRQNIRSTFKRIDGFLMPYPGLNVEHSDFSGKNGEINTEFLNGVTELVRILFNPETLEPRMIGNERITGRRLFSLMIACDRAIRDGSIPKVHNSFRGFSRLKALAATEDAYNEFKSGLEQTVKSGDNSDGLFEYKYEECIKRYVSDTSVCADDIREQYRESLTLKCQECFINISDWSDFQKRQAYNASVQALNGAWSDYKMNMKEDIGPNAKPDEKLTELHNKYSHIALKDYTDDVIPRAAFNSDHCCLLKYLINNSWAKFKQINGRREWLVVIAKLKAESPTDEDIMHQYEAQIFLNELTERFQDELDEFSHLYFDEKELLKQIGKLQSEYLDIFNDKWRYEWPEIHPFRQILLDVFESEYSDCMSCNSRNKDVLLNIMEESLFKAKAMYHDVMSKALDEGFREPKMMKNAHEQARNFVSDRLRDELREIEDNLSGDIFRRFEAYATTEYQEFCKLNQHNTTITPTPRSDINIQDLLNTAGSAMGTLTLKVNRFHSNVRLVMSTAGSVKSLTKLAGSVGGTKTVALPHVLIGAGVAAGVATICYCVYRWYQNRKRDRTLMLTQ